MYKGKHVVVPSMFTSAQQDDLMKELQRELSGHMTRVSLQGERGPAELPIRSCRYSQGLQEEDLALEVRQQKRQSQSGRRRTHSR